MSRSLPTTAQIEHSDSNLKATVDIGDQLPSFVDFLPEKIRPYWEIVQQYPVVEAFAIFAIFWALAYVIRRYVISLVQKIASKTQSALDDDIINSIRGPIFLSVIWFGVITATKSAGFTDGGFAYVTPIALTMIGLTLTRMTLSVSGKIITAIVRDNKRFKGFDVRTEPLLVITSKIVILLMAAYAILMIWGINPIGLLASAGIVGVAVGFAAKDTLANLFSGFFIIADRPYKLGDYVNLDSGERGQITHIGIRSTRILTRDDIEVTVPNGVIGNAKIVNESGGSHTAVRIRLNLQCAYDANLQYVEEVLMKIANEEAEINTHPAPRVRVRGFGESGIDLQLMGWISQPADRGRISHVMYKNIHATFKQHDLEIPYPKRDITVTQS